MGNRLSDSMTSKAKSLIPECNPGSGPFKVWVCRRGLDGLANAILDPLTFRPRSLGPSICRFPYY